MTQFMFIFRGGGYAEGNVSPSELQQHLAKWNTWVAALSKSHGAVGQPLGYPVSGKTLRGRDRVVTDGPFAESKDLVSGVLVIDAESLDVASELARGCPIFDFDGSVEVRPLQVRPQK